MPFKYTNFEGFSNGNEGKNQIKFGPNCSIIAMQKCEIKLIFISIYFSLRFAVQNGGRKGGFIQSERVGDEREDEHAGDGQQDEDADQHDYLFLQIFWGIF